MFVLGMPITCVGIGICVHCAVHDSTSLHFLVGSIVFRGGHSGEVPPGSVPIPVAKLASADGTALFSVGE